MRLQVVPVLMWYLKTSRVGRNQKNLLPRGAAARFLCADLPLSAWIMNVGQKPPPQIQSRSRRWLATAMFTAEPSRDDTLLQHAAFLLLFCPAGVHYYYYCHHRCCCYYYYYYYSWHHFLPSHWLAVCLWWCPRFCSIIQVLVLGFFFFFMIISTNHASTNYYYGLLKLTVMCIT